MSDYDDGLATGYAIARKKFSGGGTKEVESEWVYPEYWPALPNAGTGEVILLICPYDEQYKISLRVLTNNFNYRLPEGYTITIDWGDGETLTKTEFSSEFENIEHEYSSDLFGQYVFIKFHSPEEYVSTGTEGETLRHYSCLVGFGSTSTGYIQYVLAACVGKRAFAVESRFFNPMYVRFLADDLNETTMTTNMSNYSNSTQHFAGEYRSMLNVYTGSRTKRIDFTNPPEYLGGYNPPMWTVLSKITGLEKLKTIGVSSFFRNMQAIRKLSLPSLISLPSTCLDSCYSLEELYIPKCTTFEGTSISSCYSLQKVTVPADSTIDSSTFQG
ncbi:MAG: leucine-rich repeat protein, partial [Butyrivibrio sp.]